jgi:predicted transposase YbfD/YdcC
VRDLIEMTNVKGSILTWDALNTQKDTVKLTISKKAHYVAALKKNQHSLYDDVSLYFSESTCKKMENDNKHYINTVDKEQSGICTRAYYLCDNIKWLSQRKEWAGLKSIGCVRRTLEKLNGETTVETRYFLCSITDIKWFAKSVRAHWQIENNLHWHLDYTFEDDHNTTMQKNGAQNLQTMKRAALALLSMVQPFFSKLSLKTLRYKLSIDFEKTIEKVFKILNAEAINKLLLPKNN